MKAANPLRIKSVNGVFALTFTFEGSVAVRESRNRSDAEGNTVIERFEDDSARTGALSSWRAAREAWITNERPAREAMKLFERLYELHGRLEREGERYEVVLGDGILNWRREDGGISHPVLLQRAQLVFNPDVPEFVIREVERGPELYTAIFRSMRDVDGRRIGKYREQVEKEFHHPFGNSETTGFLKSFVQQLAPGAEYLDEPGAGAVDHPRMWREPVFFLRARSLGFASAIEGILDVLETAPRLPSALINICGAEQALSGGQDDAGTDAASTESVSDADVLFSKPSNKEQFQIAARLAKTGCVLVQGPPGTGKTHTIANLIGHLLANGKSVLVTSQTTKALRVLRDQVVPKLQPLCVSVLESDTESRRQLEASVAGIVRRLAEDDAEGLRSDATELNGRRCTLLKLRTELSQKLLAGRTDEYRDIVIAGRTLRPSEAARFVRAKESICSWVPSPLTYGAPIPLSEPEVAELYSTNRLVSQADEAELLQPLPDAGQILGPMDFENAVSRIAQLERSETDFKADLWPPGATDRTVLKVLLGRILDTAKLLASPSPASSWKLAVIDAGRRGNDSARSWQNLIDEISRVQKQADALQESIFRIGPQANQECVAEEGVRTLDEILGHLSTTQTISSFSFILHPSWKRFVSGTRVSGRPPRTAEDFRLLRAYIELRRARSELRNRWKRQMESLGAFDAEQLGDAPEQVCSQYIRSISDCLVWFEQVWKPLETEVSAVLNWDFLLAEATPVASATGDLIRLRSSIELLPRIFAARDNLLEKREAESQLADLVRTLEQFVTPQGFSVSALRDAAARNAPEMYEAAYQRVIELHRLRSGLERRRELLTRLAVSAPGWASLISRRDPPHDAGTPPGDPQDAWLWRQLRDELDRRSKTSIHELQRAIEDVDSQLRDVTADIIDCRAWSEQLGRTGTRQRQALIGWLDTVRRIGRGTGKRVPRLLEEAKRLMNESITAVPVWIMPLARVVDNFDPRSARFDVLIIDEASQCDVMGLIAIFMAKEVVIVGDHQQVSPDAVGQRIDQVQHLIDTHLGSIPNAHLYDGQMSVYDLARQSFGGLICLREHYRCVPDIIQFSNMLSYDWQIKPLRDPATTELIPHVVAHRVDGARSAKQKTNQAEADWVCALAAACIEQPEYDGKTFGVISLVGEEQAEIIESQLRSRLSPAELARRRLLCGNAAHFQGDERDVMFLSLVDAAVDGPLALRDTDAFRKRYNVAASRAKDQMWVIHSLNPGTDLKPGDLRRRLIQYAIDPAAHANTVMQQERRTESEFERQVLRKLTAAGYRVISQKEVGYYRIDFVVESGGRRLAVECDGDRYHPIEKLAADMERQAVLERLGWKFVRVRGSEFFRDPDRAMAPVFARLEALEIPREGAVVVAPAIDASELRERVIRRAEAIRRLWEEERAAESRREGSESETLSDAAEA